MKPEFVFKVPEEFGATGLATAEKEAEALYSELLGKGARNMTEVKIELKDSNVIGSWVIDGERYFV
ncbi:MULTISPECIES: hypothetical protein [Aliivibrio]|uniref:Uncharacterized protein n=1 Tax=Aliivibrio fischeri (strain MJ11) TaxID=388396 RepID=B5EUG1_ALIFM|nr:MULTISPECIES: hypothetical protein [Aliivibrio]ACH64541.1 conserved hypothetical protein [Aliivibrio fischeri MJ11]MBD1571238.1 hypothetical protein [Aliivibrio sp. S10_S31]MCE4935168.1 hypothetical protein [Aliivibrio fischeri]MUH97303.1 hypothetical protein [Aliivibrio fischeri]MUI64879.1 hypothetical protein [Aliivibrio fischeri]